MSRYGSIIAVVLIAALSAGKVAVCVGGPAEANSPEPANSKSPTQSLFSKDPNFSIHGVDGLSNRELFAKMMFSVLLVVVLGVAALFISKRLLPKITRLPGKRIAILETAHIGPRRAVHLVKVDDRCILIGSTNENITKLADLGGPAAEISDGYEGSEDSNDFEVG